MPGELLPFRVARRRVAFMVKSRSAKSLPLAVPASHLLGERSKPGVHVEHPALRLRLEKRLVRMLAVDIDQPISGLPQLINRCRMTVDKRARTPVPIHYAAQQQSVLVTLERLLPQPVPEPSLRLKGKFGSYVRALCAGAYLLVFCTFAKRQRQRVDQDGLSGAGLARQRGETRPELKLQPIDDGEVPYGQV